MWRDNPATWHHLLSVSAKSPMHRKFWIVSIWRFVPGRTERFPVFERASRAHWFKFCRSIWKDSEMMARRSGLNRMHEPSLSHGRPRDFRFQVPSATHGARCAGPGRYPLPTRLIENVSDPPIAMAPKPGCSARTTRVSPSLSAHSIAVYCWVPHGWPIIR